MTLVICELKFCQHNRISFQDNFIGYKTISKNKFLRTYESKLGRIFFLREITYFPYQQIRIIGSH